MGKQYRTKRLIRFLVLVILNFSYCVPEVFGDTSQLTNPETIQTSLLNSPNMSSIQETIDQAQPGATIVLPAGTFTEILTVNKPLCLLGNMTSKTILCPTSANTGYAVSIIAEGVTLSNLDITNQGSWLYTTGVKICASNTIIRNCTVYNTPIGIAIWSSQNTISGCCFRGCDDEGIVLMGTAGSSCENNTITSCTFVDNCDGIELQRATNSVITFCSFVENIHAGIDAIESNNNHTIISDCTFTNNQGFGFFLADSTGTQIIRCSFSDDIFSCVRASDTIIRESQVVYISLSEQSSLLIEQCNGVSVSNIITQHSSFEIFPCPSEQEFLEKHPYSIRYYLFLQFLSSHLQQVKPLFKQLYQLFE